MGLRVLIIDIVEGEGPRDIMDGNWLGKDVPGIMTKSKTFFLVGNFLILVI